MGIQQLELNLGSIIYLRRFPIENHQSLLKLYGNARQQYQHIHKDCLTQSKSQLSQCCLKHQQ